MKRALTLLLALALCMALLPLGTLAEEPEPTEEAAPPVQTAVPEETAAPEETAVPEETVTPEPPEETEPPAETEEPEAGAIPAETDEPVTESDHPEETPEPAPEPTVEIRVPGEEPSSETEDTEEAAPEPAAEETAAPEAAETPAAEEAASEEPGPALTLVPDGESAYVNTGAPTISILGDSISSYAGWSDGGAGETTNSTITGNQAYSWQTVKVKDTWWRQAADRLGMDILVNNSWSGSCVLSNRAGAGSRGYGDRCVNLHDDTGENAGQTPEIIVLYMGSNDVIFSPDRLGSAADVDYDSLIRADGEGGWTYETPQTTAEAYAILLHRVIHRYPDGEVYCFTLLPIKGHMEAAERFNESVRAIAAHFGVRVVDLYRDSGITSTAASFKKYYEDGAVHPNAAGMDAITDCFVAAVRGEVAPAVAPIVSGEKKTLSTPALQGAENAPKGVRVTWGSVLGAAKYRVYRKTAGGSWKKLVDTAYTTFVDTTARSGRTYSYTVRCVTQDGKSTVSKYDKKGVSVTYIAAPVLRTVTNSAAGVKVTWGKVTGAGKYRVFRRVEGGGWIRVGDTYSTSYVDTTAKSGVKYTYTVRCVSADGRTFTSAADVNGKSILRLAEPKVVSVRSTVRGKAVVKWKKVPGAEGYVIYRRTGNGKWKKLAVVESGATVRYVDAGAKSGTSYDYTVRARGGGTYSSYNSGKTIKVK